MSKKNDPVWALNKAFNEEIENQELNENYESFQNSYEYVKKRHNELVPQINQNLVSIKKLKESILNLAMEGVLAEAAVKKLKELDEVNDGLVNQLEEYQEKMDYNQKLINKYKEWSESKLFIWWQAFKAVDPGTSDWLTWKASFKDKII